jgi:molybdopterin-binding aldehyde dehydrogenase-like protein
VPAEAAERGAERRAVLYEQQVRRNVRDPADEAYKKDAPVAGTRWLDSCMSSDGAGSRNAGDAYGGGNTGEVVLRQQRGDGDGRGRYSERRDRARRREALDGAVSPAVRRGEVGAGIAVDLQDPIHQVDDPVVDDARARIETALFDTIERQARFRHLDHQGRPRRMRVTIVPACASYDRDVWLWRGLFVESQRILHADDPAPREHRADRIVCHIDRRRVRTPLWLRDDQLSSEKLDRIVLEGAKIDEPLVFDPSPAPERQRRLLHGGSVAGSVWTRNVSGQIHPEHGKRFADRAHAERFVELGRLASAAAVAPAASGVPPGLETTHYFQPPDIAYSSGAHVALAEVDPDVRIVGYWMSHGSGRLINPMIVEGQLHGAVALGLGSALFEEVRYDDAGQPLAESAQDAGGRDLEVRKRKR